MLRRTPLKKGTKQLKRSGFKAKSTVPLKKRSKGQIEGNKRKPKTLAKWKKELDTVFSKFIRQRDDGQCFTCPKKDEPKYMQCGHFAPRQYLALRFDERNCNCQCYACNMLYNGQPSAYAIRLKQKYGDSIIEELEQARLKTMKLDAIWYAEKIAYYQARIEQ